MDRGRILTRGESESDKGGVMFSHTYVSVFTYTLDHSSAFAALYSWWGEQISAWDSGSYGGSRRKGRKRMKGKGGVQKKKRRRYLKYYTYQGECSVEQALWECKLHSLLLPLGCRLLDEYNHPQQRAPRLTLHRLRTPAEYQMECHNMCMFIVTEVSNHASIRPSVLHSVPFQNDVKYRHVSNLSQLGGDQWWFPEPRTKKTSSVKWDGLWGGWTGERESSLIVIPKSICLFSFHVFVFT